MKAFPGRNAVASEEFATLESPHPYGAYPSGNRLFQDSGTDTFDPTRNTISDEGWNNVLTFCGAKDLATLAQSCRYFYVSTHQPELWRDLLLRKQANASITEISGSWKDTYIKEYHPEKFACHQPMRVPGVYSDDMYRLHSCRAFTIPSSWFHPDYGNMDRVPSSEMTTERFYSEYESLNKPVLIKGAAKEWACFRKWQDPNYCLEHTQGRSFRATSGVAPLPANFTLEAYLDYCKFDNLEEAPLYLFDRTALAPGSPLWNDFMHDLRRDCPYWDPLNDTTNHDLFQVLGEGKRPDHTWLIVGPRRSGSVFHIDPNATHAWNAAVVGRKRWIFYPPGITPPGVHPSEDGDEVALPLSVGEWIHTQWNEHLSRFKASNPDDRPLECTAMPGDVIFVPHGWWHMVINLDEINVAITHNYVGEHNLSSVLRFMKEKQEQISGCRDREESIKPESLYEAFVAELKRRKPEVLRNALLKSDRWTCRAWKDVEDIPNGRKRKADTSANPEVRSCSIMDRAEKSQEEFSFSFL